MHKTDGAKLKWFRGPSHLAATEVDMPAELEEALVLLERIIAADERGQGVNYTGALEDAVKLLARYAR